MNPSRLAPIDMLRALAVLLVLGRHMLPCPEAVSPWMHGFTTLWRQVGWVGVDLFFVLSGFLVSGLLFKEWSRFGALNIKQFLLRRALKIYPPFWLMIGVTVALNILLKEKISWLAVVSELLFVQNYGPSIWNHTWSLGVEEHFYLLVALAAFCLAKWRERFPKNTVIWAFGIVAVLCLALRMAQADMAAYTHHTHLYPTHLRIDSLLFGTLLSYVWHRDPARAQAWAAQHRVWLFPVGLLAFVPVFFFELESTRFLHTFGLTLLYLGSGCLLLASLGCPASRSKVLNGIASAGAYSYSIYLWHMPLELWGSNFGQRLFPSLYNWWTYSLFYLVGSVVLGIVMARLVEVPVLRLRDRLIPARVPLTPSKQLL